METWDRFPRFPTVYETMGPSLSAYKLPSSIGGKGLPHKASPGDAGSFSKDPDRSGTKHLAVQGRHSPGPIYLVKPAIGKQVSSRLRSAGGVHFGTAPRFQ